MGRKARTWFEAVDEDKSGSLSRDEFAAAVTAGTIK
jgi:hypothetical protein